MLDANLLGASYFLIAFSYDWLSGHNSLSREVGGDNILGMDDLSAFHHWK